LTNGVSRNGVQAEEIANVREKVFLMTKICVVEFKRKANLLHFPTEKFI